MKKSTQLIILGNLASFGPFVTDFYLPCLPELTHHFSAPAPLVQMSLTASMIGLSAGQLLLGPISDKYGRRRPLLCSLALFILATAGCIVSPNIHAFVFCRLLQGLTGACGLVVSKAIVADIYSGREMGRVFASLTAVQFISPILAPVLGGLVFSLASWQGIFVVLAVWGALLLHASLRLRESLPPSQRLQLPLVQSFRAFLPALRNRRFMVMCAFQSFVSAVFFIYIAASPFLMQHHFGLTPVSFGFCFAFNAVGLIAGSLLVIRLKHQHSCLKPATAGLALTCGATSAALLCGWPFVAFETTLFLMIFSCGVLIPVGNTLALETIDGNKGIASALLGAVAFMLGGIAAPLTGFGDLLQSTAILLSAAALMSTLTCMPALRK